MDSQHRHELGENALAQWLADKVDAIKPRLPLLMLVAIGSLGSWIAWSWLNQSNNQIEELAWRDYSRAVDTGLPDLDALEQLPVDHPDTSAEPWASVTWADGQLYRASAGLLIERDPAREALARATRRYEDLLADDATPEAVRERARFGLARAQELSGELDAARDTYQAVRGAFAQLATKRATRLAEQRTREDAEWLATAVASAYRSPLGGPAARPDSAPDPVALPPEGDGPAGPDAGGIDFDDLLKGIPAAPTDAADQPEEGQPSEDEPDQQQPEADSPPDAAADAEAEEDLPDDEAPGGSAEPQAAQAGSPSGPGSPAAPQPRP